MAVSGVRSSLLSRGQEPALQLPRPAQGRRLLVRVGRFLLAFQGQPQRVGRVLHQRGLLFGRGIRRQLASSTVGPPTAVNATARARCLRLLRSCRATPSGCTLDSAWPASSRSDDAANSGSVPPGPAYARQSAGSPAGLGDQSHLLGLQAVPQRLQKPR